MGTIKTLIESALREIYALAESEEATAAAIADGQDKLVELLDQYSIEGMMVPYKITEVFTLVTDRSAFTFQPGGDWNSASPISIEAMSFELSTYQNPLRRMDDREYLGLPNVGFQGEPRAFLVSPTETGITVKLDCVPYGGAMRVVSLKPLDSSFVLTDAIEFPPAYNRLLRTNLAIELAPSNNKSVSPELAVNAVKSKQIVTRKNSDTAPQMRTQLPGQRAGSSLPYRT